MYKNWAVSIVCMYINTDNNHAVASMPILSFNTKEVVMIKSRDHALYILSTLSYKSVISLLVSAVNEDGDNFSNKII